MATMLERATAVTPMALDHLRALCGRESYSHDREALVDTLDLVLDLATQIVGEPGSVDRLDGTPYGDCAVVTYPGNAPGQVALIAHYDTVWPRGTLGTWDVRDDDERLSLPGIFDMKFGLVQGLYALRLLQDAGAPHPTVTYVFNGDEEIGSLFSRPIIEHICREADATLVLEASAPGGAIKSGRKGIGIMHVTVTGVEAHAGLEPEKGASAIHAMAEVIDQLARLADPAAGTTINVGTIAGGTGSNVVAGGCTAQVDVRLLTADEQQRVDAGLDALRCGDERVTLVVEKDWNRPPMEPTETSRPLLETAKSLARDLGRDLSDVTVGGASDANFVAGLGRPVLCGLGAEGAVPHARHEYLDPSTVPFRLAWLAQLVGSQATPTAGHTL